MNPVESRAELLFSALPQGLQETAPQVSATVPTDQSSTTFATPVSSAKFNLARRSRSEARSKRETHNRISVCFGRFLSSLDFASSIDAFARSSSARTLHEESCSGESASIAFANP